MFRKSFLKILILVVLITVIGGSFLIWHYELLSKLIKAPEELIKTKETDIVTQIKKNINKIKTVHTEAKVEAVEKIGESEPFVKKITSIADFDFLNRRFQRINQEMGFSFPTKTVIVDEDMYQCLLQEGRTCNKTTKKVMNFPRAWIFTQMVEKIEENLGSENINRTKSNHYKVKIKRAPYNGKKSENLDKYFFYLIGFNPDDEETAPLTEEEMLKLKVEIKEDKIKFVKNNQEEFIPIPSAVTMPIMYLRISEHPSGRSYKVNTYSIMGEIWVEESSFHICKEKFIVENTSFYYDLDEPEDKALSFPISSRQTTEILYSNFNEKLPIEPTVEVGEEYYQAEKQEVRIATSIKLVEIGKEYDKATNPTEINGKLAFLAEENGKNFIVYKGEEIGKVSNFTVLSPFIMEINGKLAFMAIIKDTIKTFIWYDGKEIGKEYDRVRYPTEVNKKLAFVAFKDGSSFVVYDGKEIRKGYDQIGEIFEVDKELCYRARKSGIYNRNYIIVCDDKVIGERYDNTYDPKELNGKLIFKAQKGGRVLLVYQGQEIGEGYDSIENVIEINGKLAYLVKKGKERLIIYDSQEIGREYDSVAWLSNVNNKVAFEATKNGKTFIVYDGKEIGKEYKLISTPLEINRKLTFVADKKAVYPKIKQRFIYYGGQEIGLDYDSAEQPTEIGGKIAFVATKDGKSFIVMEK
ncbi:MAG: hypothetical protein QMC93_01285 [Patescibacteria group bacterium]|nr:hypothetical protein [Patescibacteria group bacterium]